MEVPRDDGADVVERFLAKHCFRRHVGRDGGRPRVLFVDRCSVAFDGPDDIVGTKRRELMDRHHALCVGSEQIVAVRLSVADRVQIS